jgi:hypothetical protein
LSQYENDVRHFILCLTRFHRRYFLAALEEISGE